MSEQVRVALEAGARKTFATAIDWPGWSRSGKTPELALEAMETAAPRFAVVAREAREPFPAEAGIAGFEIVEQSEGGGGTDFGVPSRVTDADRRATDRAQADRLRRLVAATWTIFDRVAAGAPAELRTGPRGGGRDRDKMIGHVLESDWYYGREIGIRLHPRAPGDRSAIDSMRAAVLEVIGSPSDGSPMADRRWTVRYAASRIAWHALDHAWEMEDRTDPG